METTRRTCLALVSLGLGGLSASPLTGDPDLVEAYNPEREQKLYGRQKPFVALYRRTDYVLGFVAAVHGTDPNGSTFHAIDKAFGLIRPAVLILEGFPTAWGENPPQILRQAPHRAEAAASSYTRGEDMHAASLAIGSKIPVYGGELTDAEIVNALVREHYDPQDVFYASLFGPLAQDARAGVFTGPSDPRFKISFDKWARDLSAAYAMPMKTDLADFKVWFAHLYGRPLEEDPNWADRGGPGEPEMAGQIGNAENLLRDRYLFSLMIRFLNQYRRVVVVYGGSHLSSLWQALEGAMGPPKLIGIV